jgi:hypothetical protein
MVIKKHPQDDFINICISRSLSSVVTFRSLVSGGDLLKPERSKSINTAKRPPPRLNEGRKRPGMEPEWPWAVPSRCRGLKKAVEFDIQLETEEYARGRPVPAAARSALNLVDLGDEHRELEAELRKMAPPNGRTVLTFLPSLKSSTVFSPPTHA